MAWETGTVANNAALFNKIRDFLTTNADLVTAGEAWTQELGNTGVLVNGDQITLRGSGLTGTDNIYCGLETLEDTGAETYNIRFWGHASFEPADLPREQSLRSGDQYILCWNNPMTYWIVANGRRWMLVVKVSTVYSSAYCGFFLPYAAPSEYPFPMIVAGIATGNGRWSDASDTYRFFASPGYNTMLMYWPDNVWRQVGNYYFNYPEYGDGSRSNLSGFIFPTRNYDQAPPDYDGSPDDEAMTNNTDPCFDGTYILRDLIPISTAVDGPYHGLMGALDGAYWVPGRSNSAENIITINTQDHLVVQNLFRTGFRDYMAIRLL